jgi:hypothetical protein
MNNINECIVWGGGPSIGEGISLGLKEQLKNKFVLGCNFSFHHFEPTAIVFKDKKVWTGQLLGYNNPYVNKSHKNLIQKFPLCITTESAGIKPKPNNLISIPKTQLYAGHLTGEFALALASYLLNENGNLFILGYDWTQKTKPEEIPITHYYPDTEIVHKGQHLTQHYDSHNAGKIFRRFLNLNNTLKIYNVSPNSNIPTFKKITYSEMFSLLNKETYNQDELRQSIKEKLNALSNNI